VARITLDFHDDRRNAASAVYSLRQVGLNADDVASIWRKPAESKALSSSSEEPIEVYEIHVDGGTVVQLSGWLATAAMETFTQHKSIDLRSLLSAADIDTAEVDRVYTAITAGGGVTAVRARDSHLQETD